MLRFFHHYFYRNPTQLTKEIDNFFPILQMVIRLSLSGDPHHHVIFITS